MMTRRHNPQREDSRAGGQPDEPYVLDQPRSEGRRYGLPLHRGTLEYASSIQTRGRHTNLQICNQTEVTKDLYKTQAVGDA